MGAFKTELVGISLMALGVLGIMGYWQSAGIIGAALYQISRKGLGDLWPAFSFLLLYIGWKYVGKRKTVSLGRRAVGALLLLLVVACALHSTLPPGDEFANGWRGYGGGLLGALASYALLRLFGGMGRIVSAVAMGLFGLMLLTGSSAVDVFRRFRQSIFGFLRSTRRWLVGFLYTETDTGTDEDGSEEVCTVFDAAIELEPEPKIFQKAQPVGVAEKAVDPEFEERPVVQPEFGSAVSYRFPPISILKNTPKARSGVVDKRTDERARLLEKTLESFEVKAKVVDVRTGPTVTRYELQPAPGVKVASIVKLANDIALALACGDVRIEAPIPGKAAVGIEVPNQKVSVVGLREVIETTEFGKNPSKLTVAFGKDIAGKPVTKSLENMVHLLIAGATGSGKSVCINSIIVSLLYRARPDELKFLMIDPKVVELSIYNGIPHLISPVVTDPAKAARALRWVLKEMTRRYEAFASAGVRDIVRFNEAVAQSLGKTDGPALPYIVVVIDELADLMAVAAAEVEDAIFRIAQMARAAGIHLVVATQRPSVDVITGTIKANIQSRVAFAVSSQVDSRTILDSSGAEKLLGRGDMLFFPIGASKPLRAQGAFVSENEIEQVVRFVAMQAEPEYEETVTTADPTAEQEHEEHQDELFPQAVRIIVEAGQASVSLLQRRLPIGYTRAARLIDVMEQRRYIGPYEGSKPREVFLSFEEYERIFGASVSA